MEVLSFVPGAVSSLALFYLTSHPKSKVKRGLPRLKTKHVEVCPNIKVFMGGRTIHFHHWLNLSLLLAISIPAHGSLVDSPFTQGVLVGGILQGLTYGDALRIVYARGEL
jgi:hypothetical protein